MTLQWPSVGRRCCGTGRTVVDGCGTRQHGALRVLGVLPCRSPRPPRHGGCKAHRSVECASQSPPPLSLALLSCILTRNTMGQQTSSPVNIRAARKPSDTVAVTLCQDNTLVTSMTAPGRHLSYTCSRSECGPGASFAAASGTSDDSRTSIHSAMSHFTLSPSIATYILDRRRFMPPYPR